MIDVRDDRDLKTADGNLPNLSGNAQLCRRRVLERGYFAAVGFAVVPLGAVYPIVEGLCCILFAVLTLGSVHLPKGNNELERFKFRIVSLFAILFAWCWLQAQQFSNNPLANPTWRLVAEQFGAVSGAISVDPAATKQGLLAVLMPFLAAYSAICIFRDHRSAFRLWNYLSTFSYVLIFFTLLQHIALPQTLLFYRKWAYYYDYTVTFVNRNTAATFVGTSLVLNVGYLIYLAENISLSGLMQRLKALDLRASTRYWRFLTRITVTFMILIGLVLTRSRAGVGATLIGLLVLGVIQFTVHPPNFLKNVRLAIWTAGLGFLLIGAGAFWMFGGIVIERVSEQGLEDTARLCTYVSTIRAIGDHFWTGTGFGTFADVFPAYRDPTCSGINGLWDRAHNSYLEFILGVGIMGIPVIALTFEIVLTPLIGAVTRRTRMQFAPTASIAIFTIVALHALVDFSIQIPGFAVFVAAALASGIVLSLGEA